MNEITTRGAPAGLMRHTSAFDFAETLARLERAASQLGLKTFARIDHAAAAREAGLALPPTTVLLVGAARAGTPLVADHRWLALDLPLRILVREGASGGVEVGANDPGWVVERHGVNAQDPRARTMRRTLSAILTEATEDPA